MIDVRQLSALDFADKDVTILGLGIEGVDLARYLTRRGATVTVSDTRPAEKLAGSLREVAGLPIDMQLGSDGTEAIAEAEALFVSQSIPLNLPALNKARRNGVPMYSMVQLFLELASGPVIGITGSSGKTTVTALVADMLRADERPVFVGGNIGVGLLDHLDNIRPYTWSVLEISHTQLQLGDQGPHIAAVLNITPNHLDRFSWDEYRELKANLVRRQGPGDIAVLNHDDPETRGLAPLVRGRLVWFSAGGDIPGEGVFVRDGWAVYRAENGSEHPLFLLDWVKLRGRHNQENAVAAAAIVMACGVSTEAVACAVDTFPGVAHRLEDVGTVRGVSYVNDSIATTPERTIAGLRSFEEPIVLLLGGRDKHLPLQELAREALNRCRAVVLFGESASKLKSALGAAANPRSVPVIQCEDLAGAVREARRWAAPGDIVLLSPACTSYDAYSNFEERGDHFRRLIEGDSNLSPDEMGVPTSQA